MINRLRSTYGDAAFFTALVLCLTIAAVGGYALLLRPTAPQTVTLPDAPASAAVPTAEHPAAAAILPMPLPDSTPVPAPVEEPKTPSAPVEEPAAKPVPIVEPPAVSETPIRPVKPQPSSLVVSPLSGQVVAAFSADRLTFNPTLGDWRIHDGVDIGAAAGTNVLAASGGTVLAVTEDDLLGTTVVLQHADGCQTSYANLQARPPVSEGDTVTPGQVIGAVGTTSLIEQATGPHLHFSVCKDGDLLDPGEYLGK